LKLLFKLLLAFALISLVFFGLGLPAASNGASADEAEDKLIEAFKAIAEAERMGGNVSSLVAELNEAIRLLEEGETYKNESLIDEAFLRAESIISRTSEVGREGAVEVQARVFQGVIVIVVFVALALVVWRYGPRLFWRLWVRGNGKRVVHRRTREAQGRNKRRKG